MNDIAAKIREAAKEEPEVEVNEIEVEEITIEPERTQEELDAIEIGWNPEGKDKDGNTLTAAEFLARKPLFNKIKNMHGKMDEMERLINELRQDNKKIAQASIKEKQELLEELRVAREKALDNLDVDEVRNLDKRIENAKEEIKEEPIEPEKPKVSPYYEDFLKENEWAKDETSSMYLAAEGLARKYLMTHEIVNGNDKPMFDYIHEQMRKDFPEKFKEQTKRTSKVASSTTRQATNYSSKKTVTLADLPEDEREVVKTMMRATGKTEEEYLKNYTL